MREQLVSYILGDLSSAERQAVEERLASDEHLRAELAQIRACLAGAALDEDGDCPPDLAHRTACNVRTIADSGTFTADGEPIEENPSATCGLALLGGHWSAADAVVAAGVVLAVTMLLAPAIRASRDHSQRDRCAFNLQELRKVLVLYANEHGGYFPHIRLHDNAGMYTLRLAEEGFAEREELSQLVLCPAQSGTAQSGSASASMLPTLEQFHHARDQLLRQFQRRMGGNYAYRLGYMQGAVYLPVKNLGDCRQPLLSDAPLWQEGELRSAAHDGGQNVLYQNGCVRFVVGCRAPGSCDHLFLNTAGFPAAGQDATDAVLGRSEVTPAVDHALLP
jgi:hypothetical protein